MKKLLHNLRQKPESVRKQYAYTSAGVASLAILLVWGVTMVAAQPFAYKSGGGNETLVSNPEPEQRGNPIQELAAVLQSGIAGATASFEEINNEAQKQYEGEARLEVVGPKEEEEVQDETQPNVVTF